MVKFVLVAIAGLGAQLVDGALGMAYGVTSTSLLLAFGLSPAAASASVHLAEIGTTLASGTAHWKLNNVDWKLVAKLGVPGAVGAFAGATFLVNLSTEAAAPVMAGILLVLGLYVLIRFAIRPPAEILHLRPAPHTTKFLAPLGLVGGFVDATGGGGWGPVTTTTLLSRGKVAPRRVIGSVDTSEFLVSLAASLGFLWALGRQGIEFGFVAALLIGGLLAAPVAAWLVSRIPSALLGAAAGGLIVFTNTRTLANAYDLSDPVRYGLYAVVVLAWIAFLSAAVNRWKAGKARDVVSDNDDEQVPAPV
ncbi:sulfite exporter TauE/SafE family protein [Dermacoccaceae bacterium W4C1]